jgi:hypothetical protein
MNLKSRKNLLLVAGALFILLLVSFIDSTPFIFSDGYGYYHTSKTLVTEGRFYSEEPKDYYAYARHGVDLHEERYVTRYAPGVAVLSAPFLLPAQLFDSSTQFNDYYKAFNGHSFADGTALMISNIFYFALGAIIIYTALRQLQISKKIAITAVALGYTSMYVYPYLFNINNFSHIYEIFAINGVILYTILLAKRKENSNLNIVLLGLFYGLSVIIRPTNLLILLPFLLLSLFSLISMNNRKRSITNLLLLSLFAVPLAILLFNYNHVSFGSFLSNGYSVIHDQSFQLEEIFTLKLLFSPVRGWFVYTPLALITTIFMIFRLIKDRRKSERIEYRIIFASLFAITLTILVYSFWPAWWGGDSIGQRFLMGMTGPIVLGVALLLQEILKQKKSIKYFALGMLTILSLYSFVIGFLYGISSMKEIQKRIEVPLVHEEIPLQEQYTPLLLLRYHVNLLSTSDSLDAYIEALMSGFNRGRTYLTIAAGFTDPIINIENIDSDNLLMHIVPTPTNNNTVSDIILAVKTEYSIQAFKLHDVDLSKYQKYDIVCRDNTCFIDNEIPYKVDVLSFTQEEEALLTFIDLNENLSIALDNTGEKIKFVNYKKEAIPRQ